MLTLISILFFVLVLKTRPFAKINYAPLLTNEELEKDSVDVQSRLIVTYSDALEKGTQITNRRVKFYDRGVAM